MNKEIELTNAQVNRQDFVDNQCYELICTLCKPIDGEIEWDIELISLVRDAVQQVLVDILELMTEMEFYPYVELTND